MPTFGSPVFLRQPNIYTNTNICRTYTTALTRSCFPEATSNKQSISDPRENGIPRQAGQSSATDIRCLEVQISTHRTDHSTDHRFPLHDLDHVAEGGHVQSA